jgi:hypothetical protein
MLVGKETDLTILESSAEDEDKQNMPKIPGLNLEKIKKPVKQNDNSIVIQDSENFDEKLTAKVKKVFHYGKLDLTDDNNFEMILAIFKKEQDQANTKKVHI